MLENSIKYDKELKYEDSIKYGNVLKSEGNSKMSKLPLLSRNIPIILRTPEI